MEDESENKKLTTHIEKSIKVYERKWLKILNLIFLPSTWIPFVIV